MYEFKKAKELIEEWVGEIEDFVSEFKLIDSNNSGTITYDEFCIWGIAKGLDMDGEDEYVEEIPTIKTKKKRKKRKKSS